MSDVETIREAVARVAGYYGNIACKPQEGMVTAREDYLRQQS